MSGAKYDTNKCRMDLIPAEAEIAEAWVWTFGAQKYGDYNWQKGISYSRLLAAAQRHLTAIKKGELIDRESGLPHAACIRCSMGMLIHFEAQDRGKELNNLQKPLLTGPSWSDTVMKEVESTTKDKSAKEQTCQK